MIEFIGAPFDIAGPMLGSRLGPASLRLFGLQKALVELGHAARDAGDVFEMSQLLPLTRESVYREAIDCAKKVRNRVKETLTSGHLPIVLGGDHSLSMGSISAALDHYGDELAVLWVDSHMDLNTPDTTPSGNLHGMPLAALTRLEPGPLGGQRTPWGPALTEAWSEIMADVIPRNGLRTDRLAWVGLRDVDEGEVKNFRRAKGSLALTMQDVDIMTAPGAISALTDWLEKTGATKLWVSFDIDALDPIYSAATGHAVRGGLTYREGHLLAENLCAKGLGDSRKFEIVGVDLVEVNPFHDKAGETARATIEWASALFGKTIFGSQFKK